MRKITFYTAGVILTMTTTQAFTQNAASFAQSSSTYIFLKPVYGFAGNSSKLNETQAIAQGITYTRGVYGSYGRGLGLQLGIGKMINSNFGFELIGEYLHGAKINTSYSSDSSNISGALSERIKGFLVKPMLVLRNSGDLLSFYSKLGLAISVYSRYSADLAANLELGNQSYQITNSEKDNARPKVGFAAGFGLSFRVSQSVAITGEVNGQMIILPPKDGHYTRYISNGKDLLPAMSTNMKSWTYERSISTAAGDPNKPGTRLYEPANFSYIGISIGITYYL